MAKLPSLVLKLLIVKFSIPYNDSLSNKDIALEDDIILGKRERNYSNSEFKFRNFICYAIDEKFEAISFIDDHFYVKTIKEFSFNGDISTLAQPNLYYAKIKGRTYGTRPYAQGDKVIITEDGVKYIAEVVSANTHISEDNIRELV